MGAEKFFHARGGEPLGVGRCGSQFQQGPEPRLVGRGAEREQRWIVAVELFAELAAIAMGARLEFLLQARQIAQANDVRVVALDRMEAGPIGAQGMGQDKGVAAIILGAGGEIAIAEARSEERRVGKECRL